MPDNTWARLLTYVTGLVNQKLLLQNESSQPRIAFSEPTFLPVYTFRIPSDRPLAEIGKRLGRAALQR